MRELLAVDGSSLVHRAWHSTRGEEDEARDGVVTAAFASMLASTWAYGPYRRLVVAFDHPVNRRRLDFPEYKAQRATTPDDLRAALERTREHLDAAGVPVRRAEGVEADDLLASLSDEARSRGLTCDLLSSDRDLIALVGGVVRLLRPRQRFTDLAVEDEDAVRATYGVDPERYVDLAALRGDPSDGLRGASGIGPARAARLVRDHGSVAAIYRAITDLPPAIARSLRDAREDVERNLLLMSPLPHLDVGLDDVLASEGEAHMRRLTDLLDDLGFPGAARRLRRAVDGSDGSAMPPIPPPPSDGEAPPS